MMVLGQEPLADPRLLAEEGGCGVWWLGQAGFVIALGGLRIVIDPYLSDSLAEKYKGTKFPHNRMMAPPIAPDALTGIDWILVTHGHTDHMDPGSLGPMLAANPAARVVVPRAERDKAVARSVPEDRLLPVDAGDMVDLGGVMLAVTASAHEELTRTQDGFLCLGYALSANRVTLWHSGDCIPYPGLVERLKQLQIDLMLLPVNGRDQRRAENGVPGNFTLAEAVEITEAAGARAMLGHHFGLFDFNTIDPVQAARELARLPHAADIRLVETRTAYRISTGRAHPADTHHQGR